MRFGRKRGIPGDLRCAWCWEADCVGCVVLAPPVGRCPVCGRAVERDAWFHWREDGPCHWECFDREEAGENGEDAMDTNQE